LAFVESLEYHVVVCFSKFILKVVNVFTGDGVEVEYTSDAVVFQRALDEARQFIVFLVLQYVDQNML
jgi:hypothetical protein